MQQYQQKKTPNPTKTKGTLICPSLGRGKGEMNDPHPQKKRT